jgi:hypothetical protein
MPFLSNEEVEVIIREWVRMLDKHDGNHWHFNGENRQQLALY